MDYDAVLSVWMVLTAWGVFVPLILWRALSTFKKQNLYLQTELKNILALLKTSQSYRSEKEIALREHKNKNRPTIFPVIKKD